MSRSPSTPSPRKEYALPKDLIAKWNLFIGFNEIKERYIAVRWFGFNLAAKAAAQAEHWRVEFWNGVYKLYPKLEGKTIEYDRIHQVVFVKEGK